MGANPAEGRGSGRGKLYGLYSTSGAVLWQARVEGRPSALHLQSIQYGPKKVPGAWVFTFIPKHYWADGRNHR